VGPNTGALVPRARSKAGLSVGCGRGSPPPAVRARGYHPRKILENSDAKPCILVTTCCELSCFLKTTAKKLGGPIHCWKSWGTSLPQSLRLLRMYTAAESKISWHVMWYKRHIFAKRHSVGRTQAAAVKSPIYRTTSNVKSESVCFLRLVNFVHQLSHSIGAVTTPGFGPLCAATSSSHVPSPFM